MELGAAVGIALGALVALVGAGVGGAGGKVTRWLWLPRTGSGISWGGAERVTSEPGGAAPCG